MRQVGKVAWEARTANFLAVLRLEAWKQGDDSVFSDNAAVRAKHFFSHSLFPSRGLPR